MVDCRFFQIQALASRLIQMHWPGQRKRINQVCLPPVRGSEEWGQTNPMMQSLLGQV